jgi:septum formation protein
MRLVLASSSPRRAELLSAAGFSFGILPVNLDEGFRPGETAEQYVARLAEAKATVAAGPAPFSEVVLGADTTVVCDGQILGKPADAADAGRMLRHLAGRTHDVLTGICLLTGSRCLVHVERSRVRMSSLNDAEIAWYIASGEPMDKAGGYAVQGRASRFIEAIDGSYSNVVGLPVARVYALIKELGYDILKA